MTRLQELIVTHKVPTALIAAVDHQAAAVRMEEDHTAAVHQVDLVAEAEDLLVAEEEDKLHFFF